MIYHLRKITMLTCNDVRGFTPPSQPSVALCHPQQSRCDWHIKCTFTVSPVLALFACSAQPTLWSLCLAAGSVCHRDCWNIKSNQRLKREVEEERVREPTNQKKSIIDSIHYIARVEVNSLFETVFTELQTRSCDFSARFPVLPHFLSISLPLPVSIAGVC